MIKSAIVENRIYDLYKNLRQKYGPAKKYWPYWCARNKTNRLREIVAIGAILTQRTSWRNADLALRNLKKEGLLSFQKISQLKNLDKLTKLIRVAGFYQSKPQRLFALCFFINNKYGNLEKFKKVNLSLARSELLSKKGIGPETADTILLYALDKPSFIIDEYTKRFVRKYQLSQNQDYSNLKQFFEKKLPKNTSLYQNFHTLIIVEQKGIEGSLMKNI